MRVNVCMQFFQYCPVKRMVALDFIERLEYKQAAFGVLGGQRSKWPPGKKKGFQVLAKAA